jgi:hypothetical protein
MATFRCRQWLLVALLSLACAPRESTPQPGASTADVARIQKLQIEHVTPRPDYVGRTPATLEWTAVAGAESYAVSVETEIEIPVFDQEGIKTTSVPWPKEVRVEPGTYYWRITGVRGGKIIGDSGRAAFVVMEP